jgi:hypothetical protein
MMEGHYHKYATTTKQDWELVRTSKKDACTVDNDEVEE